MHTKQEQRAGWAFALFIAMLLLYCAVLAAALEGWAAFEFLRAAFVGVLIGAAIASVRACITED